MSVNKAVIETHIEERRYYNCPERIVENTTTIVAKKNNSKITVKYINCLKEVFQYLYKTTFIQGCEPGVTAKQLCTNIQMVQSVESGRYLTCNVRV